ncbi:4602_t:CDS:2 [Racocetra persica]|uniref:4602_t:CDS:1 n=1 Tax=Racocetra persica TaxID=160502 RepID=A0ACA9N5R6_9GLOM|nr:4602_t:CDS:2 [Racocetra persica]
MTNNLTESTGNFKIKKYDFTEFSNLEEIGRGAFGTVYKVAWGNLTIALKNVNRTINTNKSKINGFDKELHTFAKLGKKKGGIWGCYLCDYENPIKIDNGFQGSQKSQVKKFQIEEFEVFQYL